MKLHLPCKSKGWDDPIFKVLSHNDTGAAVGNQAGILVPTSLRPYFPTLKRTASSLQPTCEKRLETELLIEDQFIGTVWMRYQFQTWSGKRSPESRVTDRLGPMRDSAVGGDVLLMQRSDAQLNFYRFFLLRQSSTLFKTVKATIGNRRWGRF